ncbi:MAG: hypothetical protein ABEJ58_06995 [Halodesulfurarchaeum sp.]
MTSYYDVVLALIPVALFGLGGGLQFAGLAQTTAVSVGGLVSVGLVGHAMFVNGPVSIERSASTTTSPSPDSTVSPVGTAD